jgi:hypothetical protein
MVSVEVAVNQVPVGVDVMVGVSVNVPVCVYVAVSVEVKVEVAVKVAVGAGGCPTIRIAEIEGISDRPIMFLQLYVQRPNIGTRSCGHGMS